jgi:hypothetical protein
MKNRITENEGNGFVSRERDGDLAAKGGPTTGIGKADYDHPISKPFNEDLQTQITAKSKKSKKKNKSSL